MGVPPIRSSATILLTLGSLVSVTASGPFLEPSRGRSDGHPATVGSASAAAGAALGRRRDDSPAGNATLRGRTLQASSSKVVAFQGGGLSAMSGFTGVLVGLLAVAGDKLGEGGTADAQLQSLFRDFGVLSSCSGGTWFAQELQYSSDFVALLGKMAADPTFSGDLFNREWMAKRLDWKGVAPDLKQQFAKCASSLRPKSSELFEAEPQQSPATSVQQSDGNFSSSISVRRAPDGKNYEVTVAGSTITVPPEVAVAFLALETVGFNGPTWQSYIELLYATTGNIDGSLALGESPNQWAQGKLGVWGALLPSPGPGNAAMEQAMPSLAYCDKAPCEYVADLLEFYPVYESYRDGSGELAAGVSYVVGTDEPTMDGRWPYLTPVKFSAQIGSPGARSPLPFCAYEDCFGFFLEYWGQQGSDKFTAETKPRLSEVFKSGFTDPASALSVSLVGSASSAAMGFKAAFGSYREQLSKNDCLRGAVWAANGAGGKAFEQGSDLIGQVSMAPSISRSLLENLASGGLHALSDCGPVDITSVAQAVAAAHQTGAAHTTVVGFQLTQEYSGAFESASSQFLSWQADPADYSTWDNSYVVFQSPRRDAQQNIIECSADEEQECVRWTVLYPESEQKCVNEVDIGTIEKATTVSNSWFGIKGDMPVTYHMIVANIKEDCQAYEILLQPDTPWSMYGDIVQELADIFLQNRDVAGGLVDRIFF